LIVVRVSLAAAFALVAPTLLQAQSAVADLGTARPIAGSWVYSTNATGSEASFLNPSSLPQLTLRCTKSTRRVMIAKPATGAAATMIIWTSSAVRAVPASFNPLTNRISIDLVSNDPLLDSLAFSRGRIGVSVANMPALVLPAWPEVARVVEDCRS
jgi:hypothetical protein